MGLWCLLRCCAAKGLDAGLDGHNDHQHVYYQGKPVSPRAFDKRPADDDGSDAEGLQEHLDLAIDYGAKVDASGFGDVPHRLDNNLAGKEDNGRAPANEMQCGLGPSEAGQPGLGDNGKAEERSADENLIGQGIDGSSKLTGHVEFSGDVAIDNIRQSGDDKEDEGPQQQGGGFFLSSPWRMQNDAQKNQGQYQSADRQGIWNMPNDAFLCFIVHIHRGRL